jgi:hypothetical protein
MVFLARQKREVKSSGNNEKRDQFWVSLRNHRIIAEIRMRSTAMATSPKVTQLKVGCNLEPIEY